MFLPLSPGLAVNSTPTGTCITSPVSACRSSKIDRTYCTLTDDELLVVRPATFIPNTTGSEALREYKRLLSRGSSPGAAFKAHIHMDHVPVGVLFTEERQDTGRPQLDCLYPGLCPRCQREVEHPAERLAD